MQTADEGAAGFITLGRMTLLFFTPPRPPSLTQLLGKGGRG